MPSAVAGATWAARSGSISTASSRISDSIFSVATSQKVCACRGGGRIKSSLQWVTAQIAAVPTNCPTVGRGMARHEGEAVPLCTASDLGCLPRSISSAACFDAKERAAAGLGGTRLRTLSATRGKEGNREQARNLGLGGLHQNRSRAVAQNLGQGIAKSFWLRELQNIRVGHGVSLLCWKSGPHAVTNFRPCSIPPELRLSGGPH